MKRTMRKRGAISPVMATVLLIAITLIAAVAAAGFIFGLMGTFISTAVVSASGGASCVGTPESCTLYLTNSGSGNAALVGTCTLNFGGSRYIGTASIVSGSIGAGSSGTVSCVSNTAGSHAASGTQITGWVTISNGGEVLFAATAA